MLTRPAETWHLDQLGQLGARAFEQASATDLGAGKQQRLAQCAKQSTGGATTHGGPIPKDTAERIAEH